MLSGQIADAIATPLVGYFSDNTQCRWGKRMPWYYAGEIIIFLSFLPIFLPLLPNDTNEITKISYFILFPSLANIGFACS